MEKVTKPNVKLLTSGTNLVAKQMQASAGDLLPKHLANMESILFIQEGECILKIHGEDKLLKEGDAFVVPPAVEHQIKAKTKFIGIHFMPKKIEFQFFK
ncbi:cupin domain-containing protein [Aequorivita marina]|uniref:cupin domain-containing protein n=1 Tax=Aequorivita marina TaxID=3073654 RepID=UPI002875A8B7|nr:cupin domain-containing protein [Aequorivita sp. S2608]MDS1297541.1 cupin domain-containing protein [Aequorivita sp. S2608]